MGSSCHGWCTSATGSLRASLSCFFFFQAEDGIRDWTVTGVQTCALPICHLTRKSATAFSRGGDSGPGALSILAVAAVVTAALAALALARPRRRRRDTS